MREGELITVRGLQSPSMVAWCELISNFECGKFKLQERRYGRDPLLKIFHKAKPNTHVLIPVFAARRALEMKGFDIPEDGVVQISSDAFDGLILSTYKPDNSDFYQVNWSYEPST